jgi:hypothetical protein
MMKMNKTQLKEAVKSVVRECLNERVVREVAETSSVGQNPTIDKIVGFVLQRYPSVKANPDKITKAVAMLFRKLYNTSAKGEEIQKSVETQLGAQEKVADTAVSDTPEKPKVSKKPASSKDDDGDDDGEDEKSGFDPEPTDEKESKPEEDKSVNEAASKTLPPNKAQYKVATARQYTTTDQNKALTIQSDPEVNEEASPTLPPNKGQYKVATPRQYATTDQNKALTIQSDPHVNEAGLTSEKKPDMRLSSLVKKKHKGIAKENHKVQVRSFQTANDLAQDPNVVRDPEVPGP